MRQVKASIPNFEALGLPEQVLMNWMERRSGLVLVTGPTGSGKSTSLASCLEYINTCRPAHIVTIEDPIEYQFHDKMGFFTQREVGIDTGSFFAGLRSALRQAPDVILLGEIRDRDSATVAVQAAETGHLVLGTLHSSGVEDTLERFLRLVPAEDRSGLVAQMANQLVGILSQQLIPAVERRTQVLVCEYLTVEGAVREWIREHKMGEVMEFMRRGESPGNRTQLQSLAEAYHTGKLSYEEAMAHAANPHEFDRMLRGVS
jgi:twitching motility protein PilT